MNVIDYTQVVAFEARLYAADEPANFYLQTADGREHLVSQFEWYDALGVATRRGRVVPCGEGRFRVAGDQWPVVSEEARPRPATVEAAVAEMVARGKESQPGLGKRLDAAGALVLEGRVLLADERSARIGPYAITPEACTCADFRHRGGWCKHRLAVRMARHLARHGFAIPAAQAAGPAPQIRAKDLALIASGQVMDEALRRDRAYAASTHGARTAALRMLGNGAGSVPAELARRAGMAKDE